MKIETVGDLMIALNDYDKDMPITFNDDDVIYIDEPMMITEVYEENNWLIIKLENDS